MTWKRTGDATRHMVSPNNRDRLGPRTAPFTRPHPSNFATYAKPREPLIHLGIAVVDLMACTWIEIDGPNDMAI
jgi:hypothetical protein